MFNGIQVSSVSKTMMKDHNRCHRIVEWVHWNGIFICSENSIVQYISVCIFHDKDRDHTMFTLSFSPNEIFHRLFSRCSRFDGTDQISANSKENVKNCFLFCFSSDPLVASAHLGPCLLTQYLIAIIRQYYIQVIQRIHCCFYARNLVRWHGPRIFIWFRVPKTFYNDNNDDNDNSIIITNNNIIISLLLLCEFRRWYKLMTGPQQQWRHQKKGQVAKIPYLYIIFLNNGDIVSFGLLSPRYPITGQQHDWRTQVYLPYIRFIQ